MKYCKYCGMQLDDGDRFCGKCGKQAEVPVTENVSTAQNVAPPGLTSVQNAAGMRMPANQNATRQEIPVQQEIPKKKRKKTPVILAVCAVISILAIGTGFLFRQGIIDIGRKDVQTAASTTKETMSPGQDTNTGEGAEDKKTDEEGSSDTVQDTEKAEIKSPENDGSRQKAEKATPVPEPTPYRANWSDDEESTGEDTSHHTEASNDTGNNESAESAENTTDTGNTEETGAKDSSYVIADSASRLLVKKDVSGKDLKTIQIAINEMLARDGHSFYNQESVVTNYKIHLGINFYEYFRGKSWYKDKGIKIDPDNYTGVKKKNFNYLSDVRDKLAEIRVAKSAVKKKKLRKQLNAIMKKGA